ncbi:MAG: SIMPL domain-containing protein [Silicimonas sp.]|nr:SIMPL domain-containing protein [Silicimonas sp.]NND22952.1 SIMPL domain-containing protein [Silicimonas sp.]NNL35710.1 SIMPL domain-containing protein [Silicimonas sp.]NNL74016.1 SIMPL domain-containing protein [Silicimonas sp.]
MRILRCVLVGMALLAPVAAVADETARRVSVDGVGRVSVVPDMAVVSLGVQREARDAGSAMRAASEAMEGVLARIAEAGIAPDDVQTTRIGLDPRWQHSQDGSMPRVVGYVASNDLSVRVRDLSGLGVLLDTVVSDGANTMQGLSFSVAEDAALQDEARVAAVEDAARKAGMLAEAAGATLGEVISISEGGQGGGPVPMFEAAEAMRSAVPVAAGQVDIVVTVRATFALAN